MSIYGLCISLAFLKLYFPLVRKIDLITYDHKQRSLATCGREIHVVCVLLFYVLKGISSGDIIHKNCHLLEPQKRSRDSSELHVTSRVPHLELHTHIVRMNYFD